MLRALLRNLGVGAMVVSVGMVATVDEVSAEPAHCINCYNLEGMGGPVGLEDRHLFSTGPLYPPAQLFGLMDCHAFNSCHSNEQPDFCVDFHYSCYGFASAIEKARELIEQGDTAGLLTLAAGPDSFIELTDQYALVRNCDRTEIVAALAISSPHGAAGMARAWGHGFDHVRGQLELRSSWS